MKWTPQLRDVGAKLLIFIFLFLIVSGIFGPWIVYSPLLYGAGFFIYGNMGKMVMLMTILFPFLIRDKLKDIPPTSWDPSYLAFGCISLVLSFLFFPLARLLISTLPHFDLMLLVTTHVVLVSMVVFLLFSVFGVTYIRRFLRIFSREAATCVGIAAVLYLGIFHVWKLWPIFSGGVLRVVAYLFSFSFPTRVVPPFTLYVGSFGVRIEQACSGLDSLFMFSALYTLIVFLDRKKLLVSRALLLYIPAALGLYVVNILRVYLIILVGAVWSPTIAIQLFHTYAGMILFMIYFFLFMRFVYPFVFFSTKSVPKTLQKP